MTLGRKRQFLEGPDNKYRIIVGFGRAKRPCAARTRLFKLIDLINMLNGPLSHKPPSLFLPSMLMTYKENPTKNPSMEENPPLIVIYSLKMKL
jgi:hypothetical protein